jgi:hypothetical protein
VRAFYIAPYLLLATPSFVSAEATVYIAGYAWSVPPPLVLLICGLALITIGVSVRKWLGRTRAPELDSPDYARDGQVPSIILPVIVGSRRADVEYAAAPRSSADPSDE